MMAAVLQDSFNVTTISVEVAGWLEEWVVEKLTGVLRIKLSQKEADLQPFAEVPSAIGETFDMRAGMTMVRPNKPVVDKLMEVVTTRGSEEIVRWESDKVEWLAGLESYIAAFYGFARQARWKVMGQLAVQLGLRAGNIFIRREVRQGLVGILDAC